MKRRTLTPEEERLWSYVTRGDVPFKGDDRGRMTDDERKKPPIVIREPVFDLPSVIRHPSSAPAVQQGNYAGIDRNTADRFRKGELPLDASLDLHGMNREKAYKSLMGFLKSHYDAGNRFVLVITGKSGILRELLPQWLDDAGLTPLVLAFDTAKQKHGGAGAFYILLRRKR